MEHALRIESSIQHYLSTPVFKAEGLRGRSFDISIRQTHLIYLDNKIILLQVRHSEESEEKPCCCSDCKNPSGEFVIYDTEPSK